MDFTKKIGELVKLGYSVGFVPCQIGVRVIVQYDKKRHYMEYPTQHPDKLTIAVLEDLKEIVKNKE